MKASDWISVKDRLPQIGERVMVYQSFNDGSTFTRMATQVKINSGSTGVACLNTNRDFIGIEKDEKYFNIAKKRINNHR